MPKEPIRSKYSNDEKYKLAKEKYKDKFEKYERDLVNYKISLRLKPFSTFHHLFVLYDGKSNEPNFGRLQNYMEADIPKKDLQEFYKKEFYKKKSNEN
ncbi:hypothetical protein FNJ88_03980 [Chryseobacterium sp. SNU WT5]|uniref:hypothetical protein n=1 Tax=Chryseobacterium sp. SNU WT5 TaxID=2594269 RepID=UPI00117C28EF|nr:hypothetical protein [Chryseobacterium sp. SNU WT5]QDP84750.1 hypothetical protein FNJ88_03980 [Chryseobacterium sp. SNU WT5]